MTKVNLRLKVGKVMKKNMILLATLCISTMLTACGAQETVKTETKEKKKVNKVSEKVEKKQPRLYSYENGKFYLHMPSGASITDKAITVGYTKQQVENKIGKAKRTEHDEEDYKDEWDIYDVTYLHNKKDTSSKKDTLSISYMNKEAANIYLEDKGEPYLTEEFLDHFDGKIFKIPKSNNEYEVTATYVFIKDQSYLTFQIIVDENKEIINKYEINKLGSKDGDNLLVNSNDFVNVTLKQMKSEVKNDIQSQKASEPAKENVQKTGPSETAKGDYSQKAELGNKKEEGQTSKQSLEDQLVEKAKAYFDSIGGDSSTLTLYPPAWNSDVYDGTYYIMEFSDGNRVVTMLGDKEGNLYTDTGIPEENGTTKIEKVN